MEGGGRRNIGMCGSGKHENSSHVNAEKESKETKKWIRGRSYLLPHVNGARSRASGTAAAGAGERERKERRVDTGMTEEVGGSGVLSRRSRQLMHTKAPTRPPTD
jgi:hypothetical protein